MKITPTIIPEKSAANWVLSFVFWYGPDYNLSARFIALHSIREALQSFLSATRNRFFFLVSFYSLNTSSMQNGSQDICSSIFWEILMPRWLSYGTYLQPTIFEIVLCIVSTWDSCTLGNRGTILRSPSRFGLWRQHQSPTCMYPDKRAVDWIAITMSCRILVLHSKAPIT